MNQALVKHISLSIERAQGLFYRLVLVLKPDGWDHEGIGSQLAEQRGLWRVNVGLELSERLLEMPARYRPLHVGRFLEDIARDTKEQLILLDNIEILFEESLKQEPLRLLQTLSRTRTVVAIWSGVLEHGNLTYAVPGHSEYRFHPATDLLLVDVGGLK